MAGQRQMLNMCVDIIVELMDTDGSTHMTQMVPSQNKLTHQQGEPIKHRVYSCTKIQKHYQII